MTLPAGREVSLCVGATVYKRHRPDQTLFYQIIERHNPAFTEQLAAQGTALPVILKFELSTR